MGFAITGLYGACIAVLAVVLAARVVILRRQLRVGVGDGGNRILSLAIRAHANLVEHAPLALLLLLLLEAAGESPWMLHAIGMLLLGGRLLHAWGLSRHAGVSFGRFYGTALTWAALLVAAGALLLNFLAA